MKFDTDKGRRIRERRRKRERAAIIERNKAEFAAMQETIAADNLEFDRRQREIDIMVSQMKIMVACLPVAMMAAALAPMPRDRSAPITIPAPPRPWWKRLFD